MNILYLAMFIINGLQLLMATPYGINWGLREFFICHGILEGVFILSVICYCAVDLCNIFFDQSCGYTYLIICSILIDIFLRLSRVLPSLDLYFYNNTPFVTILSTTFIIILLKLINDF